MFVYRVQQCHRSEHNRLVTFMKCNVLSDRHTMRVLQAKPQVRLLCRQQLICNATVFVLWAGAAEVYSNRLWQKYAAARGNLPLREWESCQESQKRSSPEEQGLNTSDCSRSPCYSTGPYEIEILQPCLDSHWLCGPSKRPSVAGTGR